VLDHLRDQAERLAALDPQVRRDTPDALHQMRVTARRMRSVLQAYGRVLERSRTRALTDELKWLGGELALARDSEVLEQRLHSAIGKLPDELVLGEVSAGVTRTLARRRAQGQEQALAALNSDRYLELHNAIDALIADPPLTEYAKRPARRELPRSVAKAWKRTQKRKAAADRAAPGEAHDEGLHETRKANKRLRYAVELAQPHVGKPAKRLRRRVKKIHSVLGDHQDAVVARPAIRELAVGHHLDGGNGFTHGLLHGLEAERADRAEHKLPAAWKKLTRPKNTKWLKN
jgi:CHAD domain-containing protein